MNRVGLIAGGLIVAILLLAGAAFVGGQLLNAQGQVFNLPFDIAASGKAPQGLYLQVNPAKEIPPQPPSAIGTFIRRADNSIFLGSGKQVQPVNQGGSVGTSSNYASEIEVVVNHETKVYRDVTSRQFESPPQNGQRVQQVVEPGRIEEIGEDSNVQVWGRVTGSRIIADVVLYSIASYLPAGIPKP